MYGAIVGLGIGLGIGLGLGLVYGSIVREVIAVADSIHGELKACNICGGAQRPAINWARAGRYPLEDEHKRTWD